MIDQEPIAFANSPNVYQGQVVLHSIPGGAFILLQLLKGISAWFGLYKPTVSH
jgi:hypothetical protein